MTSATPGPKAGTPYVPQPPARSGFRQSLKEAVAQDFPYLWRTGGDRVPEPEAPREGPDDAILGVQFNTCIDAFTKDNGGTVRW